MRARALTLIEVLIAVVVLAAVAAFIVPTYQLILSQLQLNSATAQVADFIRLAEQKTVTEQVIYGETFAVNGTSIPLFLYNTSNGTKTTNTTLTLPSDIYISYVSLGGSSDVTFATSGVPSVSGYIILTDSVRSRSREVDIRPSGAVINNQAEFNYSSNGLPQPTAAPTAIPGP